MEHCLMNGTRTKRFGGKFFMSAVFITRCTASPAASLHPGPCSLGRNLKPHPTMIPSVSRASACRALVGLALGLALPLGVNAQAVSPPAEANDGTIVLSPFQVTGAANRGYQAGSSVSASKFNQQIKDIPQTITVLTSEFLRDLSAANLADALPYVGAIPVAGVRNQDSFLIRGFAARTTYLDGFRDTQEWGSGDNAHVEQLEVLKGPASNLFGDARGFGGIINRISKRPLATPFYSVDVTAGNHSYFRAAIDATGPINESGTLRYRVNASFTDAGSFRDFMSTERYFVVPVLTWQVAERTALTLYTEFLRTKTHEEIGLPALPATATLPARRLTGVPRNRSVAEPWQDTKVEKEMIRLFGDHSFNDVWAIRALLAQTYINNPIFQVEPIGLQADQRTFNRRGFKLNRWEDYFIAEANVLGKQRLDAFSWEFLAGAEYTTTKGRSNVWREAMPTIDVLNPVYGAPRPAFNVPAVTNTYFENDTTGVFASGQISVLDERLAFFGGVRYDKVRFPVRRAELATVTNFFDPTVTNTSPRYGVVFTPIPALTVYAQISDSFRPITGGATRVDGSALAPERGELKEAGVKTLFFNGRVGLDVAAYEIVNKDFAQRLPEPNASFFTNAGSVTGSGVEVNATYNDDNWTFLLGYTNQDVRNTTTGEGPALDNTPKNLGQAFGKYTFQDGTLRGFSLGGGLIYRGESRFNNGAGRLSGYTTYDLLASYQVNPRLRFSLTARNIFDKEYYFGAAGLMVRPGDARSVRVTARYDF